jgi:hypothetical protein
LTAKNLNLGEEMNATNFNNYGSGLAKTPGGYDKLIKKERKHLAFYKKNGPSENVETTRKLISHLEEQKQKLSSPMTEKINFAKKRISELKLLIHHWEKHEKQKQVPKA